MEEEVLKSPHQPTPDWSYFWDIIQHARNYLYSTVQPTWVRSIPRWDRWVVGGEAGGAHGLQEGGSCIVAAARFNWHTATEERNLIDESIEE